jgi:organic hydroperoxide reductase OsmC/OhrA
MTEHKASIRWRNGSGAMDYATYSRRHSWEFDAGVTVPASAGVTFNGDADCVDPEEALVAAASGCHLLTFLAIAAKKRLVVQSYADEAVGYLEKNAAGQMAVTRIELRPVVRFAGATPVTAEELRQLHDSAHRNCFIANSIRADVTVA